MKATYGLLPSWKLLSLLVTYSFAQPLPPRGQGRCWAIQGSQTSLHHVQASKCLTILHVNTVLCNYSASSSAFLLPLVGLWSGKLGAWGGNEGDVPNLVMSLLVSPAPLSLMRPHVIVKHLCDVLLVNREHVCVYFHVNKPFLTCVQSKGYLHGMTCVIQGSGPQWETCYARLWPHSTTIIEQETHSCWCACSAVTATGKT